MEGNAYRQKPAHLEELRPPASPQAAVAAVLQRKDKPGSNSLFGKQPTARKVLGLGSAYGISLGCAPAVSVWKTSMRAESGGMRAHRPASHCSPFFIDGR